MNEYPPIEYFLNLKMCNVCQSPLCAVREIIDAFERVSERTGSDVSLSFLDSLVREAIYRFVLGVLGDAAFADLVSVKCVVEKTSHLGRVVKIKACNQFTEKAIVQLTKIAWSHFKKLD